MKIKLDNVLTTLLVGCALVTTGLVVYRVAVVPKTAANSPQSKRPVFIASWKSELGQGIQLGLTTAPVQLIEFADFECPFCGDFHKKLKLLQARYPTQVSLTYIHFPLPGHRFALPAARVAECANDQGHFEAMYDRLFDGQDSFGLKPWSEYATEAGISDLAAFDLCIKKTEPIPRIEQGKQLAAKLDVKGTPTLIVNGWMLGQPPSEEEMDEMVKAVLAGRSPISPAPKS